MTNVRQRWLADRLHFFDLTALKLVNIGLLDFRRVQAQLLRF